MSQGEGGLDGKREGGKEESVFHLMGRKSTADSVCRNACQGSAAFTVLQIKSWQRINPENSLRGCFISNSSNVDVCDLTSLYPSSGELRVSRENSSF